ncbi:MAG: FAD binding domain-containing protein [Verrucomicrobiota bacterium]|jgi:CO/xanthine dehydrogenase FAD-binding subunit|nr:FAD binding domain-containing protein [Verrucomicrobiota bacterium]
MNFDLLNIRFPKTLDEAVAFQADERTRGRLLAGGTDLMVQWAAGAPPPQRLISIWGLPELSAIRVSKEMVEIGAGVTHAFLRDCTDIRAHVPALVAAAASVGATQIQARGTLGGNAANASPAGDTAPALLVTDGMVMLASAQRFRTVPLTAFWTGYRQTAAQPDEIIAAFLLPKKGRSVERFRKIGTRKAQAISKIMAASRIRLHGGTIESAAIALGSVAATPIRLGKVEAFLAGKKLSRRLVEEAEALAQASVAPIADIRSSAEYRRWTAGRLVRDALENLQ